MHHEIIYAVLRPANTSFACPGILRIQILSGGSNRSSKTMAPLSHLLTLRRRPPGLDLHLRPRPLYQPRHNEHRNDRSRQKHKRPMAQDPQQACNRPGVAGK